MKTKSCNTSSYPWWYVCQTWYGSVIWEKFRVDTILSTDRESNGWANGHAKINQYTLKKICWVGIIIIVILILIIIIMINC